MPHASLSQKAPPVLKTLADALALRGYDTLTPVQQAVTDSALDGADLLVSAQTGSGKTVGFGLAIAPTILEEDGRFAPAAAPLALVIAPTRELAMQVKRELQWLYASTGAQIASCVGGMDARDERRALDRGAHIVVATPGRLRDHIMRGTMKTGALRAVVLDEADEMLDLGFREDLEYILGEAPETRRTLMFSATVPKAIATLAKNYQKDAVRVSTTAEKQQHSDITYQAMTVAAEDGENAIINVLRYHEAPNALVFCNTRAMVNRLTTRFSNRGFPVVALSGELTQGERTHALQAMRDGRARVCVATDVAARGIDLPNLELVIHADLPTNSETLLHRSGRTGRAGRKGISVLIVPPKVKKKAERLLATGKIKAEWTVPPSADEVREKDEDRLLTDPVWDEDITEAEATFADRLLALHGAEHIAAAYVRMFSARQGAPEDLADPGAPPPPRAPFGPSVWVSINVGRTQNAEPRWILPMLLRATGMTREDVGAIRIQQAETFVELRQAAAGTLAADISLEGGARITRLAQAPDLARGPRPASPRYERPQSAPNDAASAPAPDHKPRAEYKPRSEGTKSWKDSDAAPAKPATEKPWSPVGDSGAEAHTGSDGDTGRASHGKPARASGQEDTAHKPYSAKLRVGVLALMKV